MCSASRSGPARLTASPDRDVVAAKGTRSNARAALHRVEWRNAMMLASHASAALPVSTTFRAAMTVPIPAQARRASAGRWQDALFRQVTRLFAALVLALLLSIIVALGYAAMPALQKFGPAFFVTN